MKNSRIIDFSKLVKITVDFLISENLNPDEICGLSARGENNFWGKLCVRFFGSYSFKDSMYIFTAWKRDLMSYKSLVNQKYPLKKNDILTKSFSIELTSEEKKSFSFMILTFKNERKSFSSDFTSILTKKFQALGSKCLLKSDFNWFRKENCRKNGDFWVGKYTCLVCKNHFKARWIQEEMMTIIIEGKKVDHGISEGKSINPIFGEKRKLLAQEIVAKGISSFRIENSLSGSIIINPDNRKIKNIKIKFFR